MSLGVALAIALSVTASAGRVTAQEVAADPEEEPTSEAATAQARALFLTGVGQANEASWAEAASSFEAALELRPAPTIRYNLAAVLIELGRYMDAQAQLDALAEDAETPAELGELADGLGQRITREAGLLRVRVDETEGVGVTLNREPLDPRWLTRLLPVAPGEHHLAALRGDTVLAEAEIAVEAGERAVVRLAWREIEAQALGEGSPTPLHEEPLFWVAIGGGVVVLAIVAIALGVGLGGSPSDPVVGNFTPGVITWP